MYMLNSITTYFQYLKKKKKNSLFCIFITFAFFLLFFSLLLLLLLCHWVAVDLLSLIQSFIHSFIFCKHIFPCQECSGSRTFPGYTVNKAEIPFDLDPVHQRANVGIINYSFIYLFKLLFVLFYYVQVNHKTTFNLGFFH